jgi:hypothetical protein
MSVISSYTLVSCSILRGSSPSEIYEPIACFDTNCTYPYGDMCTTCRFNLEVLQQKKGKIPVMERMSEWAEEPFVQEHIPNYDGQILTGGVDDGDGDVRSNSESSPSVTERDDEEVVVRSSSDSLTSLAEVDEFESEQGEHCHSEHEASLSSEYLDSIASSFLDSISSRTSSSTTQFEPWLAELFSNNLEQAVQGDIFIGGADERHLVTEEHCPLCNVPLRPNDPHLLQCQYAHDEQERLEKSLSRQGQRQGKRFYF